MSDNINTNGPSPTVSVEGVVGNTKNNISSIIEDAGGGFSS
jgi:hypothetical protein